MRHLRVYLILFLLGVSACVYGQSSPNERLNANESSQILDSIDMLLISGKEACNINCERAFIYYFQAVKLSIKIRHLPSLAKSYNAIGIAYKLLGKYAKSLEYQNKSLDIQVSMGDKIGIAKACNNISLVYSLQNDYLNAIGFQFKSLKLKEEIGDEKSLAISYENLGKIYSDQSNSDKALIFYLKALDINKKFNDKDGLAFDYLLIGSEFMIENKFSQARENLENALKIKIAAKDKDKITSDIYNSLADLAVKEGKNENALFLYEKSLELNIKLNNKRNIAISYLNIGSLLIKLKKFPESQNYLEKSLKLIIEIKSNDILPNIYEMLMELNERNGDFKKAYMYSQLYKHQSDQSAQTNNFEKLNELGIKYETEKKEKEIKLLNKDKVLKTIEIDHQKSVRNYFVGIALIILISTFFIFRLYKNKQKDNVLLKKQKEEIEIQKKSITDSINYAYRIQKSILPSQEHFYEILPQSFVFNKPKDIVSGDFYWLHETSPFKYSSVNSKVLLALADCTGHGVPGAFMSMMGVELLNEAVNESHSPAKILQIVDEGIRKALHTNNIDSKKDGMDMALCAFDFDKNVMKYCGANRPVYRIRNNVLDIFLPQKTAVGFSEQGFVFMNQEIDIQKNDAIYLFSDGYADQFGGERDKKLTTKKFKDLLMSMQVIPIREQGLELEKFITNWAGTRQQVDDMLVIGLRV